MANAEYLLLGLVAVLLMLFLGPRIWKWLNTKRRQVVPINLQAGLVKRGERNIKVLLNPAGRKHSHDTGSLSFLTKCKLLLILLWQMFKFHSMRLMYLFRKDWIEQTVVNRISMGLLIITAAYLLSKRYWLFGAMTIAVAMTLGIIFWRHTKQEEFEPDKTKTGKEKRRGYGRNSLLALSALLLVVEIAGQQVPVFWIHPLAFLVVHRNWKRWKSAMNLAKPMRFGVLFLAAFIWAAIMFTQISREARRWQTDKTIAVETEFKPAIEP